MECHGPRDKGLRTAQHCLLSGLGKTLPSFMLTGVIPVCDDVIGSQARHDQRIRY